MLTTANRTNDRDAALADADALMGVSVIVPVYNEQECVASLTAMLSSVEQSLADRFLLEFLLVDDGSVDETASMLETAVSGRSNYRLIRHGNNRGIAAAIHTGLRAARYEIAASIDCDGSYDPLLIADMAPRLVPGVDVVTASPYHPDGGVEEIPLWRLRLSRLASQLYSVVCRRKLTCYTSCFRIYRRESVAEIELKNARFVGVAELLWKVLEKGGGVIEHPARLRSRVAGVSKMRVVRAGLGHLRLMGHMSASRFGQKLSRSRRISAGTPPVQSTADVSAAARSDT